MRLLIFEDEFYRNFYPMTFTRPIYDLRIGFYSLLKHFIDFFGFETILYVRDYLAEFLKVRFRDFDVNSVDDYDDILLINGRLMPRAANLNFIKSLIVDNRFFILLDSIGVVAARLSKPLLRDLLSQCVNGILSSKIFLNLHGKCDFIRLNDGMLISYPWELIIFNEEFLKSDFKFGGSLGEIDSRVIVYGSNSNLYLGENSRVEGNVNIDVRAGPIYVGRDVTVLGPCRIEGPSYIGDGSIVLAGARIRSGSNIGMVCRVGG
ncbi:MAG: putative sugar nucleotidyl transferase, partial [Candidatus Methanomethylicia archaeon]